MRFTGSGRVGMVPTRSASADITEQRIILSTYVEDDEITCETGGSLLREHLAFGDLAYRLVHPDLSVGRVRFMPGPFTTDFELVAAANGWPIVERVREADA